MINEILPIERTPSRSGPRLLIVSSLKATVNNGKVGLTKKFITGIREHQAFWDGAIQVLMQPSSESSDSLDEVFIDPDELPFNITLLDFARPDLDSVLSSSDIVLLMLYQDHLGIAKSANRLKIPVVYTSEYTLRTRLQIVGASHHRVGKRWLKYGLEIYREGRYRASVKAAAAIQCNGTPTYEAYRKLNERPVLFFDTRISREMLASERDMHDRFEKRRQGSPLRIMFSGRLIPMKGALELIAVASHLKVLKVDFRMYICGSGASEQLMRDEVIRCGLVGRVDFEGPLDFENELVPFAKANIDLFLCCHIQGDPSCTYLETMSCGIPIVGYSNEAFVGVQAVSECGWVTKLGSPIETAKRIAALSQSEIEEQSIKSLAFARAHTFEREFEVRMNHLRKLVE